MARGKVPRRCKAFERTTKKENEGKSRQIDELKRKLKELEDAGSPEDDEMKGDYDNEQEQYDEEYYEGYWEDDQYQQEPWTENAEEEKDQSSKESSYIFVDSATTKRDSPTGKSSTTTGKAAAGGSTKPKEATTGTSPKTKEADKDSDKEDFTDKAFKMLMENHKETLEVLLNNKAAMTEDEKMDKEDVRSVFEKHN